MANTGCVSPWHVKPVHGPVMNDLLSALTPHRTPAQLDAALDTIRQSPKSAGTVVMIVRRPAVNQREIIGTALLDTVTGLAGDNWLARGDRKQPGGHANADMQLNLMNARTIAAIAGDQTHWPLAGDQFFVDLDLGKANLPPGTQLEIGSALIEVTAEPHLGCKKFASRFGADAVQFVNSAQGKVLNLRGINARIIRNGQVRVGDSIVPIRP